MKRRAAALAFAIAWMGAGCRPSPPDPAKFASIDDKPTQVIQGFEMKDLRDQVKTMQLQSPEARLFDAQQIADIDSPIVYFYQDDGKLSSKLTAPHGRVKMDTHDVETWGGVTVVSADSSTLTTERLRYDPKTRKIRSNEKVRLEKGDTITDGVGLETDPGLHRVKIGHQTVHFKKGMPK